MTSEMAITENAKSVRTVHSVSISDAPSGTSVTDVVSSSIGTEADPSRLGSGRLMSFFSSHPLSRGRKLLAPLLNRSATVFTPSWTNKALLSFGFAVLSGYADVVFFDNYKMFCTMMTGNTFMMGKDIIAGQTRLTGTVEIPMALVRATVIAGYVSGIFLYGAVEKRSKVFGAATMIAPIVAIVIVCTTFLGRFFQPEQKWSELWWHLPFISMVFGIQSSTASTNLGASTTMVTIHLGNMARALRTVNNVSDCRTTLKNQAVSFSVFFGIITGGMCGQAITEFCHGKDCELHMMWPLGPCMAVMLIINDHIFRKGEKRVVESVTKRISNAKTKVGKAAGMATNAVVHFTEKLSSASDESKKRNSNHDMHSGHSGYATHRPVTEVDLAYLAKCGTVHSFQTECPSCGSCFQPDSFFCRRCGSQRELADLALSQRELADLVPEGSTKPVASALTPKTRNAESVDIDMYSPIDIDVGTLPAVVDSRQARTPPEPCTPNAHFTPQVTIREVERLSGEKVSIEVRADTLSARSQAGQEALV